MTSYHTKEKLKKLLKKFKSIVLLIKNGKSFIILVLVILLIISNIEAIAYFFGKLNPFLGYKETLQEYEIRVVQLEFDRVRLEDTGNILLAIQDYYFVKESFPKTLESLKNDGYLDQSSRTLDPETKQLYFYRNREEDFVFCVQLTDMVKGVNTQDCFKEESVSDQVQKTENENTQESVESSVTTEKENTQNVRVINGIPYVNVRSRATTESEIISRVDTGEILEMLSQEGKWYQILIGSGEKGWIHRDYVELQ